MELKNWRDFKYTHGGIEGARAAFEDACCDLFRAIYPNENVKSVKVKSGDGGVDIFVGEIGVEPIIVIQCKFFLEEFAKSQYGQIRNSFKTAIQSKYTIKQWILCFPQELDLNQHAWFSKWKKTQLDKYSKSNSFITYKDGAELIALLSKHSLYNKVFKIEDSLYIKDTNTNSIQIKDKLEELLGKIDINKKQPLNENESSLDSFNSNYLIHLTNEYKDEVKDCFDDINNLKFKTALTRLEKLDTRISNKNLATKELIAEIQFFKGVCFGFIDEIKPHYECMINAHRYNPNDIAIKERACFSYFKLKIEKYKILKDDLLLRDEFNATAWAINTIEANNILEFIDEKVPCSVLEKDRFQRLVYYHFVSNDKFSIDKLAFKFKIHTKKRELPDKIEYQNIHYWIFMFHTLINDFFSKTIIMYNSNIPKNDQSLSLLNLSNLLTDALKNGEFGRSFDNIIHYNKWLQFELENKTYVLDELINDFKNSDKKNWFDYLLVANSLQKNNRLNEAIDLINEYIGAPHLHLVSLKSICYQKLNKENDTFVEFFSIIEFVNRDILKQICDYSISLISSKNADFKNKYKDIIARLNFEKEEYFKLIDLLIRSSYSEYLDENIESLDKLKGKFKTYNEFNTFFTLIYFNLNLHIECAEYIVSYNNLSEESTELQIYILCLEKIETKQIEYLRLLKYWRTSKFTIRLDFLAKEMSLLSIINDWNEIYEIANLASSIVPENEYFFTNLIIAIHNLKKEEELNTLLTRIEEFNFKFTKNTLMIANVLFANEKKKQGLEIVYKRAINENDIEARMFYFQLSYELPQELFKTYEIIALDTYVTILNEGQKKILPINKETVKNSIEKELIGKKIGEIISIKQFGSFIKQYEITHISDKYLALLNTLYMEANTGITNLPIQSFKLEENVNPIDNLMKLFGAEGSQRKAQDEINFTDYHNYKISFSEIVNCNFPGNFIAAYYSLISANGIRILPISNHKILKPNFEESKLVIDFSSGLLLFEISKAFKIKLDSFIISNSVLFLIDALIAKAHKDVKSNLSFDITSEYVIKYEKDEKFHLNRINQLNEIKGWFLSNSTPITPEEKVQFKELYEKKEISKQFDYNVETFVLAQRENYYLISDDFFYLKRPMNFWDKFMSTEYYLTNKFPDIKNQILEFLINKKYIGLTLNKDVLFSSYLNQNKELHSHDFSYALQNISLKGNIDLFAITQIALFIKELALLQILTHHNFRRIVTNVLVNFLKGLDSTQLRPLYDKLNDNLFLLKTHHQITQLALIDAIEIIRHGK